jgi:hypothetical protein
MRFCQIRVRDPSRCPEVWGSNGERGLEPHGETKSCNLTARDFGKGNVRDDIPGLDRSKHWSRYAIWTDNRALLPETAVRCPRWQRLADHCTRQLLSSSPSSKPQPIYLHQFVYSADTMTTHSTTHNAAIKKCFFYLILFGLMICVLEACAALGYWSRVVLPQEIYRPGYFSCHGCKTIADSPVSSDNAVLGWGYYDQDLGWDSHKSGKRNGPNLRTVCGAAFGDSLTHGDEVKDEEVWPFLISTYMNCEIENFGVGGYGQDQAYLKYVKYKPAGKLIVIAIFQEMLRRNFAASWRFYASLPNSLPKPLFHLDGASRLSLEQPPPRLDPISIEAHHKFDRYAKPYRVQFPYFISLARVLYYRLLASQFAKNRLEPHESAWTDSDSRNLSIRILEKFVAHVREDDKKAIVLLLPTPAQVVENRPPYASYIQLIRREFPDVCVVDPFDSLREQYATFRTLTAPEGHFNNRGNAAIANAVFAAIRAHC